MPEVAFGVQLTLSWRDNSNNETGFRIQRSLDGQSFSQIATVESDTESYTDAGLAGSTRYYYRVSAYNPAGSSGYSNINSAVTTEESPPPSGNSAPTISNIPNRTIEQDSDTGPISFSVSDSETSADDLVISADSTNRTLVPLSGISIGGSGQSRSISITPAPSRSGQATIIVQVSDGQLEASDSFRLTVNPLDSVTVRLSSPIDGAHFNLGSSINLTALVSDSSRTSRVEFYVGDSKIGQDSGSPYSFSWPNPGVGSYSLRARVVDSSGGTRDSSSVVISVSEETPLTVSMISPSADESIVLGESMEIEAIVTGPTSAIKRVDFYVGTTRIKQEFFAPFTATWTPDEPGTYVLKSRVVSTTNATSDSPVRTITVTPPAVTVVLLSPSDQADFAFGEAIALEAVVSDVSRTARVDFFDGNDKVKSEYYSPYAFNWTPESSDTHSIWARVYDTAGNKRISRIARITVEAPPDLGVALESPDQGATFILGESVPLRASVEASGVSIDRVDFYKGTEKLGEDSSAPYVLVWTATPVGDQDLRASVVSSTGLRSDSQVVRVAVLTLPLTVKLTLPAGGPVFAPGESVALAASVSDESRTNRVEFYAEDTKLGEDESAPYVLDWMPSGSGSRDVFARVFENGGGFRDSAVVVVTVKDSEPFVVTMTNPTNDSVIRIGESVTVSAIIDGSSDKVDRVDFKAGSMQIKTEWFAPYEFEWTPSTVGRFSIRARARNTSGTRYDSNYVTLLVKDVAVLGELINPEDGAVFPFGRTVRLEASVSDPERTGRVEFLIDGVSVSADFKGPFVHDWRKPAAGDHEIRVRVVDVDGDSVLSNPLTVTIEDPPLMVNLIAPVNGIHFAKGDRINISATTSDVGRSSRVEFLMDGVVIGMSTQAPFGLVWMAEEEGSHIVQARAYDGDGNRWLSKAAVVTIDSTGGPTSGAYRGLFTRKGDGTVTGAFAIHVALDGSIVFLGYDQASGTGFQSSSLVLAEGGGFEIMGKGSSTPARLKARIGPDGIEGRVDELGLVASGGRVADDHRSSLYRLVGIQSMDTEVLLILGPGNQAFVGTLRGGLFRGRELVVVPNASGAFVSSDWLGLELFLDFDEGIARGYLDSPEGGGWVAGLRDDVPVIQRLENLSTRGFLNPGNSMMIVGFVASGHGPKRVLIRGVGPGLTHFGLSSAMKDPTLELRGGGEEIASNQRWFTGVAGPGIEDMSARVGAFPLDRDSADAVLFREVDPGVFSAIVRDALKLGGDTLVEIYDTEDGIPLLANLSSLSTRGPVGSGKNLIGGFVISGNMPKRILIRGIGPALGDFGVADALGATRLVLTRRVEGDEVTIGDNLGWSSNPQANLIAEVAARVGAFSLKPDSLDAALLFWLEPGVYTFVVQPGATGLCGTALVEVYQVD